ncbi:MAG: hypothetical protein RLY30_26 [Pseudomonadota bacterium]
MRDHSPVSLTRRTDYAPTSHSLSEVFLDFQLDLNRTVVTAQFQIRPRAGSEDAALTLAGDELELIQVRLNGETLPPGRYESSSSALTITGPVSGTLEVQTAIYPNKNTELMGLYASRGGLYTQCESEGFRRITYFLDRPDILATYQVRLRAPKGSFPVMLSNGNLVRETEVDGMQVSEWHDPFPKPSYLFALVAANLVSISRTVTDTSGAPKLLEVYTLPQDQPKAHFALDCLERALHWDEERFGLGLDLERFMIVAVPDFNSGAMENKGLNLFNTKFVLADPDTATDLDHELIEAVIGHEYFHNWTGNRITCRDWFQLTLKEGLTVFRDQEFSADMRAQGLTPEQARSSRAVKRIDDVRVLRAQQFPEDAGPMAHPIRPAQYQEIRNFYTATVYEKGAEVIRLLQTVLGVTGFRKGMDLYFARHDGSAAVCEDFVQSILDANQVSSWFQPFMRWYSTLGTPRVGFQSDWDSETGTYSVTLTQTLDTRNTDQQQPLFIPVCFGLIGQDGVEWTDPPIPELILLSDFSTQLEIVLPERRHQPRPVASVLRGFSAPVMLTTDQSPDDLKLLAQFDSDPFNRWDAAQRLIMEALLPTTDSHQRVERQDAVVYALRATLQNQQTSPAFQALAIRLPSQAVVAEAWAAQSLPIDPLAIHQLWEQLQSRIATDLRPDLVSLDEALDSARVPYRADSVASGQRAIRHLAQTLLTQLEPTESRAEALFKRYLHADNITSRMACLSLLVRIPGPSSRAAFAHFAERFGDNPLAMDKWFAVQASAIPFDDLHAEQTLGRVRSLLADPRFDWGNPNRVRSVLASYFMQAGAGFHRADGQGYGLWAETLAKIDAANSALAARLARSLDRWQSYEPTRQAAMRAAIESLQAESGLSKDMAEVCSKFLETN